MPVQRTFSIIKPDATARNLTGAINAVFDSWNAPRAQVYRRTYDIPDDLGTAVNVVQMVFGNRGERSGTGGLVDEMRLMVFPVILGSGRGPFPDDAEDKVKLTLADTTTYSNGVQYQVLRAQR